MSASISTRSANLATSWNSRPCSGPPAATTRDMSSSPRWLASLGSMRLDWWPVRTATCYLNAAAPMDKLHVCELHHLPQDVRMNEAAKLRLGDREIDLPVVDGTANA